MVLTRSSSCEVSTRRCHPWVEGGRVPHFGSLRIHRSTFRTSKTHVAATGRSKRDVYSRKAPCLALCGSIDSGCEGFGGARQEQHRQPGVVDKQTSMSQHCGNTVQDVKPTGRGRFAQTPMASCSSRRRRGHTASACQAKGQESGDTRQL